MAKTTQATGSKRTRPNRLYQDKGKVQELLGFDTETAFDKWRSSSLVQPMWDAYVATYLEKNGESGKKVVDVDNLIHRIREGERLGKRRFLAVKHAPSYQDAEDYHAWLVFWLAHENTTDRNGCLWKKRLDQHEAYSMMHNFVLWAKRQRHRELMAAKKSRKGKKGQNAATRQQEELEEVDLEFESEEEEDLDPEKGVAVVRWVDGIPPALEEDGLDRVTIDKLCGHTLLSFWKAVDEGFNLSEHLQRRVSVAHYKGLTFSEAQKQANKDGDDKKVIFRLHTEVATLPEEAQSVPESSIPKSEGDALRESKYNEMVDEAVDAEANRFDMTVRLWQYNLMLAAAKEGDGVDLREVTLDLKPSDKANQATDAAIQAIQVSGSHVSCPSSTVLITVVHT